MGIALLSTIAISTTESAIADGSQQPVALTDGFQAAFWVGAVVGLIGVLVSVFLVRGRDLQPVAEPVGEVALEAA